MTKSNNNPDIVANFYLECVSNGGGCPVKLRTDYGTENGLMVTIQCHFCDDIRAHRYELLQLISG